MSSEAAGEEVDLERIAGRGEGGGGVRHGDLILRFADAALGDSPEELGSVRREFEASLGSEALVDAAAIVAIFSCNVRVADATGIPLDEPNQDVRLETAEIIGIERFDETGEPASG